MYSDNDLILITYENAEWISWSHNGYEAMKRVGVDPRKPGWRRKIVGKKLPLCCFGPNKYKVAGIEATGQASSFSDFE